VTSQADKIVDSAIAQCLDFLLIVDWWPGFYMRLTRVYGV
jgi:hypothetical protein